MLNIILFLVTIFILYFLVYLSYVDYKYHQFPLKTVIMFYPLIISINLVKGMTLVDIIAGFLMLAFPMYIMQVIKGDELIFGGLDIVVAPLFSIWFGLGAIRYSFMFILVYCVCHNKLITEFLRKGNKECQGRPLVPIMLLTFLICLCFINSSFIEIIFSLF